MNGRFSKLVNLLKPGNPDTRAQGFFVYICFFFFCFATEGEQYLISAEDTKNKPTTSESRACACILPGPLSFAETGDYYQSTILRTRDSAKNWSRIPNSLSPKHRASHLKSLRRRIQNPKLPWIAVYFSMVAKGNSEKTEWSKQWVELTTFRLVVRKPRLSVHECSLRRRRP